MSWRYEVPEEYADRHVVPLEYLGPLDIPTLGWLAHNASTIALGEREQIVLNDAAYGIEIAQTAKTLKRSHDVVEQCRADITSLLLGTSILHTARIGIEADLIPIHYPKPGQTIPRARGQNVQTFDLLSRGYKTEQVGILLDIQPATVYSRMKPIFKELGVKGLLLATTTGYKTGLLHHLTPRQRLLANDPVLTAIAQPFPKTV